MKRLLIVGSGDVARRALPWLVRRFRVYALVRSAEAGEQMRRSGAIPIAGDLDHAASLTRLAGLADVLLHFAPPSVEGERDLRSRRLCAALSRSGNLPRRVVYISTTGVYGDCAGAWVGETRVLTPASARARRRVDAERALRDFARRCGLRLAILRAPGIYAAERLPLARLQRGDPVLSADEDVFTNHIHADDLAQAANLALFRAGPLRTFNASDDSALKMGAFYDLLAAHFALPPPPRASRAQCQAQLPPMTLSFMAESRRLLNARIKRELRLRLAYPTVAAGLAAIPHEPNN